jgi:hypothetical protein
MRGLTSGSGTVHGFVRSATLLAAGILFVALLLAPFALRQPGSGGAVGLVIAATVCFVTGLLSESTAALLAKTNPLAATLVGMMVRMILPLAVCVVLAATGQNGRQHVVFIGYLLTFYIVTLAVETCLAVRRASGHSSSLKQSPR